MDNKNDAAKENTIDKKEWVKPEILTLDGSATEGKDSVNVVEFSDTVGPS